MTYNLIKISLLQTDEIKNDTLTMDDELPILMLTKKKNQIFFINFIKDILLRNKN